MAKAITLSPRKGESNGERCKIISIAQMGGEATTVSSIVSNRATAICVSADALMRL